MKNINLISKNPQDVLEREQLYRLKTEKGCTVCVDTDLRALAMGGKGCRVPGNYPGRNGYCEKWRYNEGGEHGNDTAAA